MFSSEKIFQKISMTKLFFFYKNKIALTSPTLWLKKDFALLGNRWAEQKSFISVHLSRSIDLSKTN